MRKGAIKTVIESLDYQASSPDEKALVEACASLGFIYAGDDNDVLNIKLKTSFYRVDRVNTKKKTVKQSFFANFLLLISGQF